MEHDESITINIIYPDMFYPNGLNNPSISFRDGRRIGFKGILDEFVKKGYKTYEDLIEVLPGFEDPDAKGRLRWQTII